MQLPYKKIKMFSLGISKLKTNVQKHYKSMANEFILKASTLLKNEKLQSKQYGNSSLQWKMDTQNSCACTSIVTIRQLWLIILAHGEQPYAHKGSNKWLCRIDEAAAAKVMTTSIKLSNVKIPSPPFPLTTWLKARSGDNPLATALSFCFACIVLKTLGKIKFVNLQQLESYTLSSTSVLN